MGLRCAKIFLESKAGIENLLGNSLTNIAVMPGLIDDTCYIRCSFRVTKNKTVLPAVFHKPLLGIGISLRIHHKLIVLVYNIHSKACLMLAGTGRSHRCCGFFTSLIKAPAPIQIPLHLIVIQSGLSRIRAVSRGNKGLVSGFFAVAQHLFKVIGTAGIHFISSYTR